MTKIKADIINQDSLTVCESRVLKLLCEGMMRKEIARKLFRSYSCVSKQIESIAAKLDAHSAAEIVAIAVAEGLVEISVEKAQPEQTCRHLRHLNNNTRAPPTTSAPPYNARHPQNQ